MSVSLAVCVLTDKTLNISKQSNAPPITEHYTLRVGVLDVIRCNGTVLFQFCAQINAGSGSSRKLFVCTPTCDV